MIGHVILEKMSEIIGFSADIADKLLLAISNSMCEE